MAKKSKIIKAERLKDHPTKARNRCRLWQTQEAILEFSEFAVYVSGKWPIKGNCPGS